MGIDATQGAILTGAVEGGSIREPALTIVRKQNPKIKLIATGAEMFPNFPGVVVAVLGAFADKNPKAVESLVRVVVRATNLLKEDPKRAASFVGAAFGKGLVPEEVLLDAIKSPQTQFTSDPRRIVELTAKLQDYQVKLGALAKAAPLDGLFARRCMIGLGEQLRRRRCRAACEVTRTKAVALAAFGFAVFLAIWELAPALGFVPELVLPPPSVLPQAFLRELTSGVWFAALLTSLRHYLAGLVIGCTLGVGLGVATGMSDTLEASLAWVIRVLRPIPASPGCRSPSSGSASMPPPRSSSSASACSCIFLLRRAWRGRARSIAT